MREAHRLPVEKSLLGPARRVRRVSSSPRSRVWLARFDGTPAVVKQIVGEPDAAARFEREHQALRLAARADPPIAPRVLGVDPQRRVLILERLPTQKRTMPPWVTYAEGLARLHRLTTADDGGSLPPAGGPSAADLAAFSRLCARFDLVAPADELTALLDRLAGGGHHLLHGDPCAGNALTVDGQARFIDFEHAALGNGLAELAYLRIGFPTCWSLNVVAGRDLVEAEAAYRLQHPDVTGNLGDHCVGWLLRSDALVERARRDGRDHFDELLKQDWTWGFVGARQRLAHRLHVVSLLEEPELAATAQVAARLRERMIARWPECARTPHRAARTAT